MSKSSHEIKAAEGREKRSKWLERVVENLTLVLMLYLLYMWANVLPFVGFLSRVWLQSKPPHNLSREYQELHGRIFILKFVPPSCRERSSTCVVRQSVSSLDWKQLQLLQESSIWTQPNDHIEYSRRYYISLVDSLQLVVVESCRNQVRGSWRDKKNKQTEQGPILA
jgi:hypothetical protein